VNPLRQIHWGFLPLLAVALVLTLIPLPEWLRPFRPYWLTLTLFYLGIFLPQQNGVIRSWLLGVFTDGLSGTLLGIHAVNFAFTSYVALLFHQRLRLYAVVQQMSMLTLLMAIQLVVEYLIRGATDGIPTGWHFWMPLITTPLFWPLLYLLGDRMLHPYHPR
jgi:rod shape-determining protein MreD